MKVTVVRCECSNSKAHCRLESTYKQSASFFSIEEGKAILKEGLDGCYIAQTTDETAATMQELEACGLPATEAEAWKVGTEAKVVKAAAAMSRPPIPDQLLQLTAMLLRAVEVSAEARRKEIAEKVADGTFTIEEGEKILALAAEIK